MKHGLCPVVLQLCATYAGASIPPNTLEQVPPYPSLPLSLPLPFLSLPSLSLPLEVGPLIAARGSGGAL